MAKETKPPAAAPKDEAGPVYEYLGIEERPGRQFVAVLVKRQGTKVVSVEELQRPTHAVGANERFKAEAGKRVLR